MQAVKLYSRWTTHLAFVLTFFVLFLLTVQPVSAGNMPAAAANDGTLTVNISPAGAVTDGAQWTVDDGTTWHNSGDTVSAPQSVGILDVKFRILTDWGTPADDSWQVQANVDSTINATYSSQFGHLKVTITPDEANADGAFWSIVGDQDKYASGFTLTNIKPGNYQVFFPFLNSFGWTTNPGTVDFTIVDGQTTQVVGEYSKETGELQVNITPAEANTDGALWSIDGGANWHTSGTTLTDVSIGTYTLTFEAIDGWIEPADQSISIQENQLTTANETYTENLGALQVILEPEEVRNLGARWSIDDGTTWHTSGTTLTDLNGGDYQITFNTVDGFASPVSIQTTVSNAQTTQETGTYEKIAGELQIIIQPEAARAEGSWRIDDPGYGWKRSGETVTTVPNGEVTVAFDSQSSDWAAPANMKFTVEPHVLNSYEVSFLRNRGTLSITITDDDPDADVNADGARWKPINMSTWYASGESIEVEARRYLIEFRQVDTWTRPDLIEVTVPAEGAGTATATYRRNAPRAVGTVMDEFGNPMTGVSISVTNDDTGDQWSIAPKADGTYAVHGLSSTNTYILRPIKKNFRFSPPQGVVLSHFSGTKENNFVGEYFPSDLSISGVVRSSSGERLEGAQLRLNGDFGSKAFTDSNGIYRFEGLTPGDYTVYIDSLRDYIAQQETIEVTLEDSPATGVDAELLKADLRITGEVFSPGFREKLPGVEIQLTGNSFTLKRSTDSKGFYTFRGLPAGDYTLEVLDEDNLYLSRTLQVTLADKHSFLNNFIQKLPQTDSIRVGGVTVAAETMRNLGDGIFETEGLAFIGLHQMVTTRAPLTLDVGAGTITGNGSVEAPALQTIGGLVFYDGPFTIRDGLLPLTTANTFGFYGVTLKIQGAENTEDYLAIKATFTLQMLVLEVFANATFHATSQGTELANLDVKVNQSFKIKDWGLTGVKVTFNPKDKIFGGGATVVTPLVGLGGLLEFFDGQLNAVGINVSGTIPIYPPVLYFSSLSGALKNIADPDKPLALGASLGVNIGPEVGPTRILSATGTFEMDVAGSWLASVTAKMFSFQIGFVSVAYEHLPHKLLKFKADIEYGIVLVLDGVADVTAVFEPFGLFGSASLKGVIKVLIFSDPFEYTLAGISAVFDPKRVLIFTEIFGAPLEAIIDDKGLRITKPDWLAGSAVMPNASGAAVAAGPNIHSNRIVVPVNNSDVHTVPDGLATLNLMIAWDGEEGITPTVTAPDGTEHRGTGRGTTFIRMTPSAVSYTFNNPQAGRWRIDFPTGAAVDEFTTIPTFYEVLPGVAIEVVEQIGNRMFDITLSRSGFAGELVDLYYAPVNDPALIIPIATDEELGEQTTWTWDASTARPGRYDVYARVRSGTNRPFIWRYEDSITIGGDNALRVPGRPAIKLSRKGMRVNWEPLDVAGVAYYRVYVEEKVKRDGDVTWFDVPQRMTRIQLDTDQVVPGRRYKVSVAARFEDGSEGPRGRSRNVKYRSRRYNNAPYFNSVPEEAVTLGDMYNANLQARDFDKDDLHYQLLEAPTGTQIDPATGSISWTPTEAQSGPHSFEVQVTDGNGGSDQLSWQVFANNPAARGLVDARAITTSNGEKGWVLAYWNPHRNMTPDAPEKVQARLQVGPASLPVLLRESGPDSGYFAAVITSKAMQRAAREAGAGPSAAAIGSGLLTISPVEGGTAQSIVLKKR